MIDYVTGIVEQELEQEQEEGVFVQPAILDLPITTLSVQVHPEIVLYSYLNRSFVHPLLERNADDLWVLTIHRQGAFATFDIPYIHTEIILAEDGLLALLISYHGTEPYGRKHNRQVSKGQFWRFYQQADDGQWGRCDWKHLNEEIRTLILAAYEQAVQTQPWMNPPGKLRAEYASPRQVKTTSYKLVRVVDGRYYSIYKPDEEYILGEMKSQRALPGHRGGYFSYPDAETIVDQFMNGSLLVGKSTLKRCEVALLECEIGGRIITYKHPLEKGYEKWASTYLRPVTVLMTFTYWPL